MLTNLLRSFPAITLLLVLGAFNQTFARDADIIRPEIGTEIDNFELKDFRGKEHKLATYTSENLVVLAFLGTECPLARLYSNRLQELHSEYQQQGVVFLGLFANQHDSVTEISAHARRHKLEFPLIKDLANRVADQVGAERTPEVVVLDTQMKIRYRGRIDDQYQIGVVRDNATREDLKTALDELLSGKQVSKPEVDSIGCHIGRVLKPQLDSKVTFAKDIAPIMHKHCVQCHREGEIAPFALTDYDEVVGWAEMIAEVVEDQRMPPWHADPKHGKFRNARVMSTEEKNLIFDWVEAGAPKGNSPVPKNPHQYFDGWTFGQKPDRIINITETPYKVAAEGEIRYKYFTVDPKFEEDVWFKAAQLKPGNRAVVHHILVFAIEPGQKRPAGEGGFLVGYVPGHVALPFPRGMAKRIKAGSKLVFQMHYTPIGTPEEDLSQLGLVFADPAEIEYEVRTISALNRHFKIPAGDNNYQVEAKSPVSYNDETLLLGFMPHMHLRGKSFRYEKVSRTSGETETLLDIPAYDFNWQTAYKLQEPIKMPKGSYIHATAHFDNSKWNLNNPNPNQTVRWGDQTWEEMMIGYFDVAIPYNPSKAGSTSPANPDAEAAAHALRLIRKYDRDGDGVVKRYEVGTKGHKIFDKLDQAKDKVLTQEDLTKMIKQYPALIYICEIICLRRWS